MADEYSDEEFAHEDAEPPYEAEFDDDEDDHNATAVYEDDHDGDSDDAIVSDVADAYQESYDAEFDPPDVEEPTVVAAPAPNTTKSIPNPKIAQTAKSDGEADKSSEALIELQTDTSVPGISSKDNALLAAVRYPGREKVEAMEKENTSPTRSSPVRRSSEPRMKPMVPEIERCVDPELQAKLIRRSSSPRIRPIARLHSVGELSAAAPGELGVPANAITEEAAQLTRRSSSPRMRPAPVARLPSVGEFSPAAPDELEVPTNAITEEAAAIGSVVANDGASQGLVKRHSSHAFVPRLPSLREVDGDISAKLEAAGIGTHTTDNEEDEDNNGYEDKDEDDERDVDDDGDDNGVDDNERSEENGEEDVETKDAHADDSAEKRDIAIVKMRGHDAPNHENKISASGDANDTKQQPVGSRDLQTNACDPSPNSAVESPFPRSTSPQSTELIPKQPYDKQGGVQHHNFGDSDAADDDPTQVTATFDTPEGRHDDHLDERPAPRGSQEENSARSSPLPLSEHLPDDDTDIQDERLQNVMVEVEAKEVAEIGVTEDLDDDTEWAVDTDDDSRRETQHLLQEAQNLMTLQTPHPLVPNASGKGDPIPDASEIDAAERYGDEDQFSDDGYDEDDQELMDGAYYDSDPDEVIDEDQPSQTVSSISGDQDKITPRTQVWEVQSTLPSSLPDNKPTALVKTMAKSSVERATTIASAQHGSPKKPVVPRQSSLQSTQSESGFGEAKQRAFSQGSSQAPASSTNAIPNAPARKPDVPKLTPKAPIPRHKAPTPRQSHRIASTSVASVCKTAISSSEKHPSGTDQLNRSVESPSRESREKPVSPAKSDCGAARPASPTRGEFQDRPESPPRKAPVFKQNRPLKPPNPEGTKKKLKPVKCPPNLRIDLPHVDKEKREWLLLNMFRHGDNIDKYEPFIPTTTPEQTIELYLQFEALKRPLSARQIYEEPDHPPRRSSSHGPYSRHVGRKLVDRPMDPRIRERERNWISSNPSVSSIPQYDSILDKYCKTVTSPVVQRRIYETRMDDLSPQLAMVLEKRAFKEWKHSESEGFGAVSTSYKTAVVATKITSTSSMKHLNLHAPRPPSSPSPATTSPPDA